MQWVGGRRIFVAKLLRCVDILFPWVFDDPCPIRSLLVVATADWRQKIIRLPHAPDEVSFLFKAEELDVLLMLAISQYSSVGRPLDATSDVLLPCLESSLIGGFQMNKTNRCAPGKDIVHCSPTLRVRVLLSQIIELLQLNHRVSQSNGGALVSLVSKSKKVGWRLMFPETQGSFESQERCPIFD